MRCHERFVNQNILNDTIFSDVLTIKSQMLYICCFDNAVWLFKLYHFKWLKWCLMDTECEKERKPFWRLVWIRPEFQCSQLTSTKITDCRFNCDVHLFFFIHLSIIELLHITSDGLQHRPDFSEEWTETQS